MLMTPFDSYRYYHSIRQHFSSDYDAFKYNFKSYMATTARWNSENAGYTFQNLARNYAKDKDLKLFYIANVLAGKTWIRDMDSQPMEKKQDLFQAFSYNFKKELKFLLMEGRDIAGVLKSDRTEDKKIPLIVISYNTGVTSLETLTCIDSIVPFLHRELEGTSDPLNLNRDLVTLVNNYKPFLREYINIKKMRGIMKDTFTS